ncbi:MAG: polysaccharide pyruvyl transferase family protein [Gordonia sp. (in: high G+C Gram-positive bacteria)]|uniref:polysaccharide pyruvyl transferase family protein n=1 Tax=Gordonia sp. (in: high G+C Gram-positive bacteria) TaxID=84139 RepID=UPI0039E65D6C
MAVDLASLRHRARRAVESRDLIYLVSPAGHPNYGDELIAEAWLTYLARHRPLATVVVDSPRPGQAALLLRHANRRAIFVSTLWELTRYSAQDPPPADVDPAQPWDWAARAASRFGPAPMEGHGVDLLLRATTLHLVGGGYVNAVWPHQVALVAAIAEVARTTGARAVGTGLGLTPPVPGLAGERLRTDAAAFEVIDVRDRPSMDLLDQIPGASFDGDDAWLSPRVRRPKRPGRSDPVILCAQGDLTDDFRRGDRTGLPALAEFIEATLDAWSVPGHDVTVVEGMPASDRKVADLLGDRLAGATVVPFIDVWRDGLPTGTGATWLSTRFHPHLLAAASGDSGVAIVPKPDYYGTKHASLIEAGSAWTLAADGDTIPDRPTAGGFSADAVRTAQKTKTDLAARLYPAGVRLR